MCCQLVIVPEYITLIHVHVSRYLSDVGGYLAKNVNTYATWDGQIIAVARYTVPHTLLIKHSTTKPRRSLKKRMGTRGLVVLEKPSHNPNTISVIPPEMTRPRILDDDQGKG
jgi:hypothetical protein